jgi:hypothetical protein
VGWRGIRGEKGTTFYQKLKNDTKVLCVDIFTLVMTSAASITTLKKLLLLLHKISGTRRRVGFSPSKTKYQVCVKTHPALHTPLLNIVLAYALILENICNNSLLKPNKFVSIREVQHYFVRAFNAPMRVEI